MATGTITTHGTYLNNEVKTEGVSLFPNVTFFRLEGNIKAIKCGVALENAMTAGTNYLICTASQWASNINWYHMIVLGRSAAVDEAYFAYLNVNTSGAVYIRPTQNIPAGAAIWVCEYYI